MAHRIERVNKLIKQILGQIILENEDFGSGVLVTILAAETSSDLQHTKITISVFPTSKSKPVLAILERHIFELQQLLNKKLQMRPVPKIRFTLSQTEAEAEDLDRLFENKKE